MTKRRKRPYQANRVDQLLDELLADHSTPEAILGQDGLLKQLTKRLVERALSAELGHHLTTEAETSAASESAPAQRTNSRNGYSAKTV